MIERQTGDIITSTAGLNSALTSAYSAQICRFRIDRFIDARSS
jgi:hypothetical protein